MMKIYNFGQGGRHTRSAEASAWRIFTAQIARNIKAAHPEWSWSMITPRAEQHARVTAYAYNRAVVNRTMEAV